MSHLGICCSINYRAVNRTALFSINYFGLGSGLNIVLSNNPKLSDGISGALSSNGLMLLLHHPYDFPSAITDVVLIRPKRDNFIAVYPIITTCAPNVLELSPQERKCVQPTDYSEHKYDPSECEKDCFNDKVHATCGCHPYYLPLSKKGTVRSCNVSDVFCFKDNFCEYFSRLPRIEVSWSINYVNNLFVYFIK